MDDMDELGGRLQPFRTMQYANAIRDRVDQNLTPAQRGAAKRKFARLVKRDQEMEKRYIYAKEKFYGAIQYARSPKYEDEPDIPVEASDIVEWTLDKVVYHYRILCSYWDEYEIPLSKRLPETEAMADYLRYIAGLMREAE